MNLLARFFAPGRLARPPKDQCAGRVLPPASVQRSHLGLRAVDLPGGVVTLRSGAVVALLRVTGVTLHQRSEADALRFLERWAAALNALPPSAAWLVRSRPGGLDADIRQRRTQAAALAARHGTGSGLARLAADQLTHLEGMQRNGTVRQTDNYVALRNARGDVAALLADAAKARGLLEGAGVRVAAVTDGELARAIAESWNPALREQVFLGARDQAARAYIDYWPGHATVRPGPAPSPLRARVTDGPTVERMMAG